MAAMHIDRIENIVFGERSVCIYARSDGEMVTWHMSDAAFREGFCMAHALLWERDDRPAGIIPLHKGK